MNEQLTRRKLKTNDLIPNYLTMIRLEKNYSCSEAYLTVLISYILSNLFFLSEGIFHMDLKFIDSLHQKSILALIISISVNNQVCVIIDDILFLGVF